MNSKTIDICLFYEEGTFEQDEFNEIKNDISEYGLKITTNTYGLCGKGGIDLFSPILELISFLKFQKNLHLMK